MKVFGGTVNLNPHGQRPGSYTHCLVGRFRDGFAPVTLAETERGLGGEVSDSPRIEIYDTLREITLKGT